MRAFLIVVSVLAMGLPGTSMLAAADSFRIVNDSRTEVNARIRLYNDDFVRISVGNEVTMELPNGRASAGVEMKTRKQWDNCFVYAYPGAVIRVTQDHAQIKCRVR